jgi:hypothetical protein
MLDILNDMEKILFQILMNVLSSKLILIAAFIMFFVLEIADASIIKPGNFVHLKKKIS